MIASRRIEGECGLLTVYIRGNNPVVAFNSLCIWIAIDQLDRSPDHLGGGAALRIASLRHPNPFIVAGTLDAAGFVDVRAFACLPPFTVIAALQLLFGRTGVIAFQARNAVG
jgi:hypothetical protein